MILPLFRMKTTGFVLIVLGIGIILIVLPFSEEFDRKDSLAGNLIRNFIAGEIVMQKGEIKIVPDRDETLDREFREYLLVHPKSASLPESDAIDVFYESCLKDKMFRNDFKLKMEKMKVITKKEKIAVPYMYITIISILIFMIGVFIILPKKGKLRERIEKNTVPEFTEKLESKKCKTY